jgi:hypothetical protein
MLVPPVCDRRLACGLAAALMVTAGWSQQRAAAAVSDAQVKAAYLQKLPSFVEWPQATFADARAPLVIAVAGADPVYQELRELARTHAVLGRSIEVRRARAGPQATLPQVLFIGADAASESSALLANVAAQPVLTVADAPAAAGGAVLRFVERDGRVRFEAYLGAAQRQGLRLSANLLTVAVRVSEGER